VRALMNRVSSHKDGLALANRTNSDVTSLANRRTSAKAASFGVSLTSFLPACSCPTSLKGVALFKKTEMLGIHRERERERERELFTYLGLTRID